MHQIGDTNKAYIGATIRNTEGQNHIYIGGSNPWRECDADGWVPVGGMVPETLEIQLLDYCARSGSHPRDREHDSSKWCSGVTHWRPAAPSPALTPEAVRGVLRGEKAEPQWTAPITRKIGNWPGEVFRGYEWRLPGAFSKWRAAAPPMSEADWNAGVELNPAMEFRFLQSEWDRVHAKAEEPAKEELKPDPVAPLSEWMQALGMLSPYAPSMEIDVSDPVSMARQIMAAIEATLPPKPPKPLTVADQALTLTPIDGRAGSWRP